MNIKIIALTKDKLEEAVEVILEAELDTREEIEHHLRHTDAHYIALDDNKIIGVIGWYQDNVSYAIEAMGDKFPGPEAYWVGFFAVKKEYRGKGIGHALFQKLEEVLRGKGIDKLYVSSVPEARAYYERQGFKLIMEGKINNQPKFFLVKNF